MPSAKIWIERSASGTGAEIRMRTSTGPNCRPPRPERSGARRERASTCEGIAPATSLLTLPSACTSPTDEPAAPSGLGKVIWKSWLRSVSCPISTGARFVMSSSIVAGASSEHVPGLRPEASSAEALPDSDTTQPGFFQHCSCADQGSRSSCSCTDAQGLKPPSAMSTAKSSVYSPGSNSAEITCRNSPPAVGILCVGAACPSPH
mmetsp:Transcript_86290/g.278642  ORF Transcript_86290/g.278642 Transcript_86290/m.278642 type:complete len:205 (+) Transcript_86290:4003-4617(+)